jgi:hypothetical protein
VFEPGAGFPYYDSFLTVLRLQAGPPAARETFAWITLDVDRRPRP